MENQPTMAVRPDRKGPKNIAILLFISAFLVAGMGYQDWQLHHNGLNDSQIEVFLTTPNSQEGEPTSVEDYRDFESSVQEENGYLIRAVALLSTAACLLVGSVFLHRLQRRGAILSRRDPPWCKSTAGRTARWIPQESKTHTNNTSKP